MSTIPVATTKLTFDDEFNNFSSSPDGSSGTWMTSYPYGGEAARTLPPNNEAEYYSDTSVGENPFSLANGVLSINASPAAAGSNPYNLPYDSGLITTDKSFSQLYGYFEVSAELPSGQGLWPAFWLLPASNQYTAELDVFEQVDANDTTIYSTVHGSTNGTWSSNQKTFTVSDTAAGFHTYGVDWEPATTTFYVDGKALGSVATPASMNSPMFMLLNLAVGGAGSWPGAPNSSTILPASMKIDDVRAYATANTRDVSEPAAPSSTPATTGSGVDMLALSVSEDAWQGDAQFTVRVDGIQIGGVQTATASHAANATQTFDLLGNFSPGQHTLSVDFLNDASSGNSTQDRNLYVAGCSINGAAIAGSRFSLLNSGLQSVAFTAPGPASGPTILGNGADTLALSVSEDAWQGNAQFTISVDGSQIGGVQTATASHAAGAAQTFDVLGNFSPGQHTLSVDFLNDGYGSSAAQDRNLYVTGGSIDGSAIAASSLSLLRSGSQSVSFSEPAGSASPTADDGLDLRISEDAWNGDANYTVSVDGKQVGGVRTATASHAAGASQDLVLTGNWGSGPHTVGIAFINAAGSATSGAGRHLYVDSLSYDGQTTTPASTALMSNGSRSVAVGATSKLTLLLSEDAYHGDAHYSVAVDGKTVVQAGTVTTSNATGQAQSTPLMLGTLAPGAHDLAISYLNDLYGGSPTADRNLYVEGVELNGNYVPGSAANLQNGGIAHISLVVPST